jgi:hypothetical protein
MNDDSLIPLETIDTASKNFDEPLEPLVSVLATSWYTTAEPSPSLGVGETLPTPLPEGLSSPRRFDGDKRT